MNILAVIQKPTASQESLNAGIIVIIIVIVVLIASTFFHKK